MQNNTGKIITITALITIFIVVTVISLILFFKKPEELKEKENEKAQNNIELIISENGEVCDYAKL